MQTATKTPNANEPLSEVEGVYRYRKPVGGRTAWYAMNAAAEMIDFRIVDQQESEVSVVADLIVALRGEDARKPFLKLISSRHSASASISPALLSRIFQHRLLATRAVPPKA